MKQGYAVMVKQALKRCVSKNILVQVKGTGASGSFKINNEKNKVHQYKLHLLEWVGGFYPRWSGVVGPTTTLVKFTTLGKSKVTLK